MLIRIITWIFVIGIIYRLLSRYIFPFFHFTSANSDRIRQMQDRNQPVNNDSAKSKRKKEGDYIDYEEVK